MDSAVNELSVCLDSMTGVTKQSTGVTEVVNPPHLALYKNCGYALDQERRWRAELENDRRILDRSQLIDSNRKINVPKTSINPWALKSNDKKAEKHWILRSCKLMLAEWFLFMPEEFENTYLMKFCPKGRHVFVISEKGQTNIYSRTGLCLATVLSRLPGGGMGQSASQMHRYKTMLDCIMIGTPSATLTHKTDTCLENNSNNECLQLPENSPSEPLILKVLDLVIFRSTSYAQQTFYERSQWLEQFYRTQIEEWKEGDVVKFEVVSTFSCDKQNIYNLLSTEPPFEIDGVLFYHSDVKYKGGPTPLVGWLKPYMLPEWFPHVPIHPNYLKDMSPDYQNYRADIKLYRKATRQYKRNLRLTAGKSEVAKDIDMNVCEEENSIV